MEKETKLHKFSVEIKQSRRGTYYLGSLKVNGDTIEEIENLIETSLSLIKKKINLLNYTNVRIDKHTFDPEEKLDAEDELLFEKLRQIRLEISKNDMVPAYVILHDSTLKGIAIFRPNTEEELLKISGIGHKKLEKYGKFILDAVNEFEDQINRKNNFILS